MKIRLESCTLCQLRCTGCPSHTPKPHRPNVMGKGYLKAADFARLLEKSPCVKDVELSDYGEIFLNPELSAIMAEAKKRGVSLSAWNGVNLNTASETVLRDVVRIGAMKKMSVSLDGASRETYGKYRLRGDFDRVIENVKTIVDEKRRTGSETPALKWQFVVFGHNEHEIVAAREMAKSLGMSFAPKMNNGPFSPIKDKAAVMRDCGWPAPDRNSYAQKTGKRYMGYVCHQLFDELQINYDGRVFGCCRNYWGAMSDANAFEVGMAGLETDPGVMESRLIAQGLTEPSAGHPCLKCDVYAGMLASGNWYRHKSEVR